MIVSSALADESVFTPSKLVLTVAVTIGLYLVFILFGLLVPPLLGVKKSERPYYSMLSVFGNSGFVGIPLALSILGTGSMLYVVIVNVFYNLFFYSYGYRTISKASGRAASFRLSSLLNPGIVSCLIAIGIYLFPVSMPDFVTSTMDYISSCTTFLSMVVLGINMATTPMKKVLAVGRMYLFSVLRILVLPIGLSLVLGRLLPEPMMTASFVLMAAMPAGSMSLMLATEQGADTDTLTSGIILSTLMCILTVPLVFLFVRF